MVLTEFRRFSRSEKPARLNRFQNNQKPRSDSVEAVFTNVLTSTGCEKFNSAGAANGECPVGRITLNLLDES